MEKIKNPIKINDNNKQKQPETSHSKGNSASGFFGTCHIC